MPASTICDCSACGGFHELILFSSDQFDWNSTYEFTCPSTADLVCVQIPDSGQSTNVKPEDAVVAREVSTAR
jgi:hypothetical protein